MTEEALNILKTYATANGFKPTDRLQHFVRTNQSHISQMITRASSDPELLDEQLKSILEQDQSDQAQLVSIRKSF